MKVDAVRLLNQWMKAGAIEFRLDMVLPFLRTLAPFRGIDGVFGSVFVCVCLLGWVFRFLLECLAGCLYPFFLDIAGSSDPATENQKQKLIPRSFV